MSAPETKMPETKMPESKLPASKVPAAKVTPKGPLPPSNSARQTAVMNGLIDSVLHKLGSFQSDQSLECMCVGVVSSSRHVGVSTVVHRLAAQAALKSPKRILIVDANWLHPNQHQLSSVLAGPGLIENLTRAVNLDACLQRTANTQLDLLAWGSLDASLLANPAAELKGLFDQLRQRYQTIFVDLPCMEEFTAMAAMPFAAVCDGVMVVVDGAESKAAPNQELVSHLTEHGIQVLGAIMNRYSHPLPKWLRRWF